jgi:LmbE family N-acetylglucosaminyl deacetylase
MSAGFHCRRPRMLSPLQGRVVIVSPHLDDAVLSIGTAIVGSVRGGAAITVLTVFAGEPSSRTPAGRWDRRSGFSSEGQACRIRREEDRAACAILGATPQWLPFADEQYDRRGGEAEVLEAVVKAIDGSDMVAIPGWPLANADHAWLSQLLVRSDLDSKRIALYAEQPYCYHRRRENVTLGTAAVLQPVLRQPVTWTRYPGSALDQRAKRKAVRAYRSQQLQLRLLFWGLGRMLAHELKSGGEALAWVR